MRVVVVGATGNVGTSLVEALSADAAVESVLGLARRLPASTWRRSSGPRRRGADELVAFFRGADCVVHLAWLIQPSHDRELLWRVERRRLERLFARRRRGGRARSSSTRPRSATYSPGPKDRPVDESWPTDGIATSQYSRQKADRRAAASTGFEAEHPAVRVVRLRPGLIFKRASATRQRRLFLGPLLPQPPRAAPA